MTMTIEIQCPVHGALESIELPNSYENFEGEIVCPTPGVGGRKVHLRVKLVAGNLMSVERART